MTEYVVNKNAVDRISKDLADKVQAKTKDMPVVQMKDGKGSCPVCSQELRMLETLDDVQWIKVQMTCQNCGNDLIMQAEPRQP